MKIRIGKLDTSSVPLKILILTPLHTLIDKIPLLDMNLPDGFGKLARFYIDQVLIYANLALIERFIRSYPSNPP